MKINRIFLLVSIFFITLFIINGCEQLAEMDEPEIGVELADGTVETMQLEEYIEGVVAGEIGEIGEDDNARQIAYSAQSIIARSYAMKYMEENDTDTISGDFREAQEYKPEEITEEISNAVQETRGEIAKYEDRYIKGWFHANAWGHTTTAEVGLAYEDEEPPYIKPVESPDDEDPVPEEERNWSATLSADAIVSTLEDMGHEIGELENINIGDQDETGRIIDLEFVGSEGSADVKAANFRVEYDPRELRSTKIDELSEENGNYVFEGSGFGHGVGMSQWGAYVMGLEGTAPEEIVKHYFEGIEVIQAFE